MKSLSFFVLVLFACISSLAAAETGPRPDAIVDWKSNKIYLRAEWVLNRRNAERATGDLRAEMRSVLITKLSAVVDTLWRRAAESSAEAAAPPVPDLASYWSGLKLNTFQVAENRVSATMEVTLRGQNSLLAHLPALAGKEDWRSDDTAVNVAYERRADMKEYDASETEPLLYSGLVVDARHLNFIPSLTTGIYTSSGKQLYGPVFLNRATLVKRGVAGFFTNEGQSDARQRAGNRPLKVPALDVARQGENALVISDEDAAKILAHDGSVKNLKRARVVILIAPDKLREKY
ncbi:MAG: hypothetical protein J0L53_10340 [Spirochaetes bacterium]|nr:hypothetical protein [Spirochaetota bacterium]